MTLQEYKDMRLADVQFELERRIAVLISQYTMTKAMRRGLQLLAKGSGTSQAEKAELQGYATQFAQIDPIEVAANAAKARINALTAIPEGDDSHLVTW